MRVPTLSPPLVTPGESLFQTLRKPKTLPTVWRLSFRPVTDPWAQAEIEMVDVAMTPASEPTLTNPEEVQEAIRGLKVSQGSGPERYPEQGLEESPTASGISPGPDFQRDPPHPSLP